MEERNVVIIIEDNPEEMKKACQAVRAAGLEYARANDFPDLLTGSYLKDDGSNKEMHLGASCTLEFTTRVGQVVGLLTDFLFDPRFRSDQLGDRAKFNRESGCTRLDSAPGGLCSVILALAAGLPVVICTAAGSSEAGSPGYEADNHHVGNYGWFYDGFMKPLYWSNHEGGHFLLNKLDWVEKKNWKYAVERLAALAGVEIPATTKS